MRVIEVLRNGTEDEIVTLINHLLSIRDLAWSNSLAHQGTLLFWVHDAPTQILKEFLATNLSDGATVRVDLKGLSNESLAMILQGLVSARDRSWIKFLGELGVDSYKVPPNPIQAIQTWLYSTIYGENQCTTNTTDTTPEIQRSKREGQLGG